MKTIIGAVVWKRRVGRCRQCCHGSQRVPLDEALGLCAYQATDEGFIRLGCLLSVMMPYGLASWLLGQWSGVSLSASSLWNGVQHYGAHALATLELELEAFDREERPTPDLLPAQVAQLCLAISADGVMVTFRLQQKTPKALPNIEKLKLAYWFTCKVV